MARDNEEKGERKGRRNKGIKITDSQKDCAAITLTRTHTQEHSNVKKGNIIGTICCVICVIATPPHMHTCVCVWVLSTFF